MNQRRERNTDLSEGGNRFSEMKRIVKIEPESAEGKGRMLTNSPQRHPPNLKDSAVVEPSSVGDLTEREEAASVQSAPVGESCEPPKPLKSTLISPIPALLAASMRGVMPPPHPPERSRLRRRES